MANPTLSKTDPAAYLPRTRAHMAARGWDELDVLLVTGDGYVDHASFGVPALGRLLEAAGYRVGILDCPELEPDDAGWQRLPTPRLFTGVSAGTIDSMVTGYTASRQRRKVDVYRPGGMPGRPNRATIAYTAAARRHFRGVPVIIGGLEAGPRRLAHHDYWQDGFRRSMLLDSKADLLVWGMGERAALEIARRCESGEPLSGLPGTCELVATRSLPDDARSVPSYEELAADPECLVELYRAVREENRPDGRPLIQSAGANRWVLVHPPEPPASTEEIDRFCALPFRREVHPDHREAGIPALESVRWSVNTHRGCFADCSFCSIAFHQGRTIQSRSPESILAEVEGLAADPDFRGTISDVGGPTANMYGLGCKLLEAGRGCLDRDCLLPEPCPALRVEARSEAYRDVLQKIRHSWGVKHAFVSSGIRHDLLRNRKGELLPLHRELVNHHVSGRMKLAPEHASPAALEAMNKTSWDVYEAYERDYKAECASQGRDQHLVNYFVVGHPGTGLAEALELFEQLLKREYSPEQVQEFIPLPMTRACVQYAAGIDPETGKRLYVPRGGRERRLQKALVRWKAPENEKLVIEALTEAGRQDLLPALRHALARARSQGRRGAGRGPARRPAARADLDTCG